MRLNVDVCTPRQMAGWIDDDGPVIGLEFGVNGGDYSPFLADRYRSDLEKAGMGDGRRGFVIEPTVPLKAGDRIFIRRAARTLLTVYIVSGDPAQQARGDFGTRSALVLDPEDPGAHDISQRRWRGDEPNSGLTFGALMTGDTLWDLYLRHRTFRSIDRILEIGPGYGRLLKTALERGILFASWTAVELSAERVRKLQAQFGSPTTSFLEADIETWSSGERFDVVICSSTFEHLHPDCRRALKNVRNQLDARATVFIDFIAAEKGGAGFEGSGTYVHLYTTDELAQLFPECRFVVRSIDLLTMGEGQYGAVSRFVVAAEAV